MSHDSINFDPERAGNLLICSGSSRRVLSSATTTNAVWASNRFTLEPLQMGLHRAAVVVHTKQQHTQEARDRCFVPSDASRPFDPPLLIIISSIPPDCGLARGMAPKKGSGFWTRLLDVDERLTFYGAYHANLTNKLIHILCVWPILLTALVFLWRTPELPYPELHASASVQVHGIALKFNAALLATVIYVAFYLALEVRNFSRLTGVGFLAAALSLLSYFAAGHLHQLGSVHLPLPKELGGGKDVETWQLALGVHVASWAAQFVGHGVFEGRRPALCDNIVQAFVMAPVFVLLEAVFLVGLKKELHDEVQYKVNKAIAKHKEAAKAEAILKTPGRVTRSRSKKL